MTTAQAGLDPRMVMRWRREIRLRADGADPGEAVHLSGRSGAASLRCAQVVQGSQAFDCLLHLRQSRDLVSFCTLITPGVFERDHRHFTEDVPPGVFVVVFRLPGEMIVRRRGGESVHGPGELVILPSREPMTITFTRTADPAGLMIPFYDPGGPLWHRGAVAQTLLGRSTAEFVRELAFSSVAQARSRDPEVEFAACDLLRAVLDHQPGDLSRVQDNSLVMRAAVHDLIGRRCTDPAFGVADIARELQLSRRHLYRHFANSQKSLADMISERRLAIAQDLLRAPKRHTLAEIAAASGFGSAATLRTRFRAEIGVTPAEYRQMMRVIGDSSSPIRKPARPVLDPVEEWGCGS